ncbi:MAG TPA: Uma2 family endonuclease [Pirellulales bacterium]|nr:Uma2 family endonuclease [Pirellulales bacterium]
MASVQHDVGSAGLSVARVHPGKTMTEEEFVGWCDEDTRAEWVDGEVIVMSPVSVIHNRLTRFLISLLQAYVEERDMGEVLGTEVSVRINSKRRRLPDVLFVAQDRADRLHENHFEGAPNLIIEVVSPDSVERDWRVKYSEYEAAGVDEYWVIDPLHQRLEAYALNAEKAYQPIALFDGKIVSRVVPGFFLRPEWLWRVRPPKLSAALNEILAQPR